MKPQSGLSLEKDEHAELTRMENFKKMDKGRESAPRKARKPGGYHGKRRDKFLGE